MFYQGYNILMSHARPDAVPLPRIAKLGQARAESAAARAMHSDPGSMKLSERLRNPLGYIQLQQERRQALEALLAVQPTMEVAERALDLICMIAEESTWSANPAGLPFDDENRPEIDLQCAETAVLFGWTHRILGSHLNEIDPRIVNRMLCEVRRRLFKPVQVHVDYPFMTGSGPCPMTVAADLLLACLLLESDEARTSRILKHALRFLDETCGRHGRELLPLEQSITDISAVTDLAILLRDMTKGGLDLTDSIPTGDWLDEILFSWIQDQLFNDPAGDSMRPMLSGCDVFRIGYAAGDDPLAALGAMIFHANHQPSRTVTGRLMELSACAALENVSGKPPRLRYAALRNNMLMAARIPGLYCSMHVGGGRQNAGDIVLMADGAPILVDGGRACIARSVPSLAGCDQLPVPGQPCIADFEDRADREIMSVDLTHAYPAACGLRSYQRTVLTLRNERTVRVMDAVAFDNPGNVCFSFVTAAHPTVLSSAVRLGPVRVTWEGSFIVSSHPLEGNLHQLTFELAEPVQQAIFAFNFEKA